MEGHVKKRKGITGRVWTFWASKCRHGIERKVVIQIYIKSGYKTEEVRE